MNRHIITALGFAFTMVLGSCSNDQTDVAPAMQDGEAVISFTLSGDKGRTRGDDPVETQTTGEKNINKLYVLSYKASALKAVVEAAEDEGTYTANVGVSGSLDLYFIANPSEALETALNNREALPLDTHPSALLALTETVAPNLSGDESSFLMTGHETRSVASGDIGGTNIGQIPLSRAVARIDITSLPENFTLEKVVFKNRYTATKLGRLGNDTSMDGIACNTVGAEYTAGITSGSTTTYTSHIYGYEDLAGTTVLVIDGKYNGLDVKGIQIDFSTLGENNAPVPLQRNKLYQLSMQKIDGTADLKGLEATLTVMDWDDAEIISKTSAQLADRTSTPAVAFSAFTNCAESEGNIAVTDNTAATFTVTVSNTGSTLSKLVCSGVSYDGGNTTITTGEGISITAGAVTYSTNGTSTQVFTVAIEANASGSQRVFTLKAENMLNRDSQATFTVTQPA